MRHLQTSVFLAIALLTIAPLTVLPPASAAETSGGGIEWFGTWKGALAEAKRTGRPILLISAAPHCKNISGIW